MAPFYQSLRFFKPSKLDRTPIKDGTRPPCTEDPVFSRFPSWITPNERWHPSLLNRSPRFFRSSKLERTPNEKWHPSPLYRNHRFFRLFKLERIPMKDVTPLLHRNSIEIRLIFGKSHFSPKIMILEKKCILCI